ncbi:MAG: hypothetical protein J6J29_00360 [Paludibacteraceae bacterium]|nr:hypothetical protein [Paludibacteraceae bacterium]
MKKHLFLLLLIISPLALMAEKLEKVEPSLLVGVGAGASCLDDIWRPEANIEVNFGAHFRTGHAMYLGFAFNRMNRETTESDKRTGRTNFPIYLLYQWRAFGWNKNMADKHNWSPYVGIKAGWNFIQDVRIGETVAEQNNRELEGQVFAAPQVGIDLRCAEYLALGITFECEFSRRYFEYGGNVAKPRFLLTFRF